MGEERRERRLMLQEAASGDLIVRVTPTGRLEWITPDAPADHAVAKVTRAAVEAPLGDRVISAQEQALISANREKIEELKTLRYPSPDLHDVVGEMLAMTHPPALSLAVAAWVLQATGLIPMPVFGSAAAGVTAVGYVGRRVGHRLHAAQVTAEVSDGAQQLWKTHPGIAASIVLTVLDRVLDSVKDAMSVDDTELENELDAFYPTWSRTDFEFALPRPRRVSPKSR